VNLHGIVSPYVSAVNPSIRCTLKISNGFTVGADYSQQPSWATYTNVPAQIQPISSKDLQKLDGLNLTGIMRKFYLYGYVEGVDRPFAKGGDLIVVASMPGFPSQTTWLVNQQLEAWGGWCCVATTLQNGS
jgi:hypothetical protein